MGGDGWQSLCAREYRAAFRAQAPRISAFSNRRGGVMRELRWVLSFFILYGAYCAAFIQEPM